jgi:hypothetical protein
VFHGCPTLQVGVTGINQPTREKTDLFRRLSPSPPPRGVTQRVSKISGTNSISPRKIAWQDFIYVCMFYVGNCTKIQLLIYVVQMSNNCRHLSCPKHPTWQSPIGYVKRFSRWPVFYYYYYNPINLSPRVCLKDMRNKWNFVMSHNIE